MKSKIMSILVVMLFIASAVINVIGGTDVNASHHNINEVVNEKFDLGHPSDFEVDAYCGGFTLWTDLYRIQIDSQGHGVYSICYAEDRDTADFTEIIQFNLDQNEMNQLWDEIVNNDFFNLNESYSESDIFPDTDIQISGGTFANIIITANGEQHVVETQHIDVPEFDNIMMAINSVTPGDNDLFYNGLLNIPPFTPASPSGPTSGNYRQEHTYVTSAFDIDLDDLYYRFDWGDGEISDWMGPFEPLEIASLNHKWSRKGDYE